MAYYSPYFVQQPTFPQFTLPPQQQQPQQQTEGTGLVWVTSEAEAASHLVMPNSAVALWDSTAPVVYVKQADASGRPTLKTYDLVERTQTPPKSQPLAEYVTKADFEALLKRVEEMEHEYEHPGHDAEISAV